MKKTRQEKFSVGKNEAKRLDKFLASHAPDLSRAVIQRLIKNGAVSVDGRIVRENDHCPKKGQTVTFYYDRPELRADDRLPIRVVYEDSDVIVIDKPAGVLTHPNSLMQKSSVAAWLVSRVCGIAAVGDKFRPGIVHRLDADTSGLMIAAKNLAAFDFLKRQFAQRKVEKFYLALVHGRVAPAHGMISVPVGRRSGEAKFKAGLGREAKTEYWVVDYYSRKRPLTRFSALPYKKGSQGGITAQSFDGVDLYSLLRIQLHTGRTHQIRVHMSYLKHPVAGDRIYGGQYRKDDVKELPRQFLHAEKLKLKLPGGETKEFLSPLPNDLEKYLKMFERAL